MRCDTSTAVNFVDVTAAPMMGLLVTRDAMPSNVVSITQITERNKPVLLKRTTGTEWRCFQCCYSRSSSYSISHKRLSKPPTELKVFHISTFFRIPTICREGVRLCNRKKEGKTTYSHLYVFMTAWKDVILSRRLLATSTAPTCQCICNELATHENACTHMAPYTFMSLIVIEDRCPLHHLSLTIDFAAHCWIWHGWSTACNNHLGLSIPQCSNKNAIADGLHATADPNSSPSKLRTSCSGIPRGQYHFFLTCMMQYKPRAFMVHTIAGEPNQESATIVLPEWKQGSFHRQTEAIVFEP